LQHELISDFGISISDLFGGEFRNFSWDWDFVIIYYSIIKVLIRLSVSPLSDTSAQSLLHSGKAFLE